MRPAWSTANAVIPSFLPWSDGGTFSGMKLVTLALYGAPKATESRWTIVFVLSRMIRPSATMPSPVAETFTESSASLFGDTVCVTRGWAVLALRTKTDTGTDDPGWRFTSTDVAVTVTRLRIGASIGIRATALNVTSRG